MRKLSLLFMGVLATIVTASAQKVTEQQALQKAQQFMQGKTFTTTGKARHIKSAAQTMSSRNFYVFNAEDNRGFVIVSGDERTPEILGYAEEGNFDLTQVPSNVKWWMEYYDQAIASLDDHSPNQTVKIRKTTQARDEILPLISTKWHQYSPYNSQCPLIGDENCVTGCVATAMGEVMNYWKWPETVAAIEEYTTLSHQIFRPALEATTFDWNNMSDDDYARLMVYCGQAVHMDYDTAGSGTQDPLMARALINNFGYDSGCHIIYRNGYNKEDWEDIIYNELKNGRPVIYGGTTDQSYGHAFICHGYKNYMYYINWGWGGACDGYFLLSLLDPKEMLGDNGSGFIYDQDAVIGIQKPTGNAANYKMLTTTKLEVTSEKQVTRKDTQDNFKGITFDWNLNPSLTESITLNFGFALYQDNALKEVLLQYGDVEMPYDSYIYYTQAFDFGAGITDGHYQLKAVYKTPEASTWELAEGANYRYIDLVISGNTLTITNYPTHAIDKTDEVIVIAKSYIRTYGDENPAFEFESEGATLNGTPDITCEATAASPVGTYPIVITQGNITNGYSHFLNGTLTITKAPLTIEGGSYTINQGEELPTFVATYSGFKNGETEEVLKTKPTLTTTATSSSTPGTYEVYVSGATADNYEISYTKGTLTITEVNPITLTAKSYIRTYGDENPTFEFETEGATLIGTPTITCEATTASPVGTYPIIITKGSVENHNDAYVDGTLTITQATLKIKAEDKECYQYEAMPTFTLQYDGFRNGDTEESLDEKPSITCDASDTSVDGKYTIRLQGGDDDNYRFELTNGTLTILIPLGIEEVLAEDANAEIYTPEGRRASKPVKGINIIKMSNGTTKKVFVR